MECDKFRSLLVERQEGIISPEDAKTLDRHLSSCDRCRQDLALIGVSFETLRSVRDADPPTHYFTNLLPRIRQRIENRERRSFAPALPLWVQRILAPGSALGVLGSIVALYVLLTPSFDPTKTGLRQIVSEVPRDEIDRVAESASYSDVLTRTMEPSQRMLETLSNPGLVSQHIDRMLVDDQLEHGHTLSIFLAGDSPFEDIAEEDVDSIILKLDKTSL
jgi:Putative zinc-finger